MFGFVSVFAHTLSAYVHNDRLKKFTVWNKVKIEVVRYSQYSETSGGIFFNFVNIQ